MQSSARKMNSMVKVIAASVNMCIMMLLYLVGINLKYSFCFFTAATYLILMPRRFINPKNIVFAYYFIWYCTAPIFANRYKDMYQIYGDRKINMAYIMCYITYSVIMLTLEILLWNTEHKQNIKPIDDGYNEDTLPLLNGHTKIIVFGLFVLGLAIYIDRTGGLLFWLSHPNDAFFNRRGSGLFYLLFTHCLFIMLYFEGQRVLKKIGDYIRRFLYILLFLGCYIFIGSRSTTFMMLLILFCNTVMTLNIFHKKSVMLMLCGVTVFVVGMFVRVGTGIMSDISSSISTILNYFDTFDNLLIMLRDLQLGFGQTFFLPFNWPFVKLGTLLGTPFYDMSVWLTTIYYPDSWVNGGTTQWPLESDIYLSFYFFGGLPFVIAYFAIIAYIYKKAQHQRIWRFIYIIEGFYIVAHLRGGLLIFWYWWLVPMYLWLINKYDNNLKIRLKI